MVIASIKNIIKSFTPYLRNGVFKELSGIANNSHFIVSSDLNVRTEHSQTADT